MPEVSPLFSSQWQISPATSPPQWLIDKIRLLKPSLDGRWAARLLWQRGIQQPEKLAGFLAPEAYQPTGPEAFGAEMATAIARLVKAWETGDRLAIWGDFDADGVTATAVLWEGLGQFFGADRLSYYIPNRLTESHGLSCEGLAAIAAAGTRLVVTCDTGSTCRAEIDYAQDLGLDLIITDHHTLLPERPPVLALINPRSLPPDHPLATLSGVAVAYKLVEALYAALPQVPQQPLESLLDLVAIGLIADLVELRDDCRYLAQRGIRQLQRQQDPQTATRPGITRLLELCQKSGDRPTDISFGIGPRINAVSRIHGDARFCVELLTSRDRQRCAQLALETELANTRRKSLQQDVFRQASTLLARTDLSTTSVIVLAEEGWPVGVLGLVANQVAQEYGRPTILLSIDLPGAEAEGPRLARGSARSLNGIDLYDLVADQQFLLHRFGGHPFAAGLSLPADNIPLFRDAINQQFRQRLGDYTGTMAAILQADLVMTVADLSAQLFHELKLLEPCGMGNPVPRLLIQRVWFDKARHFLLKDSQNHKTRYILTKFELWDATVQVGFPSTWWGHYREDLPNGLCDAMVELDFNARDRRYEVRLIAVRPTEAAELPMPAIAPEMDWIVDGRASGRLDGPEPALVMGDRPLAWDDFRPWFWQAYQADRPLVLAYPPPDAVSPQAVWQRLLGIAKYLSRTGQSATQAQIQAKLNVSDRALRAGFAALECLGFQVTWAADAADQQCCISWREPAPEPDQEGVPGPIAHFWQAVQEEQFRHQYFYEVPLGVIQTVAQQQLLHAELTESRALEEGDRLPPENLA